MVLISYVSKKRPSFLVYICKHHHYHHLLGAIASRRTINTKEEKDTMTVNEIIEVKDDKIVVGGKDVNNEDKD
jgi:hypothetical protein